MPTNRQRRRQPQREGNRLTPAVRAILTSGMDFFDELSHFAPIQRDKWGAVQRNLWVHIKGFYRPCFGDPPSWTPDERLDFLYDEWAKHRDEVLKWHIDEHRDGSRPWAWWMWSAAIELGEGYPASEPGEDGFNVRRELRAVALLLRRGLLSEEEKFLIHAADAAAVALRSASDDEAER